MSFNRIPYSPRLRAQRAYEMRTLSRNAERRPQANAWPVLCGGGGVRIPSTLSAWAVSAVRRGNRSAGRKNAPPA